jgi:ABC-type multidrug transport system fused ATPase/permease subunit
MKVKSPISVAVLLLAIPAAFLPALMAKKLQQLTDEMFSLQYDTGSLDRCIGLLVILILMFLVQLCVKALQDYSLEEDQIHGQHYLKQALLKCKCEVRYPYIENEDRFQERLELVNRFAGDKAVRSVSMAVNLITTLITFISVLVLLLEVNPVIVGVILITSFPAAWITYKQNDEKFFWNMYWSEKGALIIHYYGILAEEKHMQEVRHYGLYPYLLKRWHSFADSYSSEKRKMLTKHTGMSVFADILRSVVYIIVLMITAWQIYQNPILGLGLFSLVLALTGQMQNAASMLLSTVAGFFAAIPSMQEFFYLQDLPTEENGEDKSILTSGDIEYRDVSFQYPGADREALTEINVSIKTGEKIAIVGDNGSGKSTFISLLCGMLQTDKGSILVGGCDVTQETARVRNSISAVFQDFAHYEDTIRNNVTVSDISKNTDDEKLYQLFEEIHLDEVIKQQELGLNSKIGSFSENSNNLSGGQWQKIALARAAFRDKGQVMVLDEPTSALDPMAEAQLYEDFTKLTGKKTTLLVSHRLGITSVVDRILVFRDGRIVEDGTHQELMERNGHYARMYKAQAQWYE